jgi:hypothetical protein
MGWADWYNACKISFLHKILAKNQIFYTEDEMCMWANNKKKIWKKYFFGILKINEEGSRIRIHTKMSRIPNTVPSLWGLQILTGIRSSMGKIFVTVSKLSPLEMICWRNGQRELSQNIWDYLRNLKLFYQEMYYVWPLVLHWSEVISPHMDGQLADPSERAMWSNLEKGLPLSGSTLL